MKKWILPVLIASLFSAPLVAFATPVSWDKVGTFLQPLLQSRNDTIRINSFIATSTTATSTVNGNFEVKKNATLATTTNAVSNGVVVVDGYHYPKTAAGITAAIAVAHTISASSTVLIPQGTYTISGAQTITPLSNVTVRCENGAVFNHVVAGQTANVFTAPTYSSGGLTNFTLENCTFIGGRAWYSSGNLSYSKFLYNKFYGDSNISSFLVFFDAFADNPYNTVRYNLFSGSTGSGDWDMLGSGNMHHGDLSFNRFEYGNGQGLASNGTSFARLIGNTFLQVGNIIGMEGTTTGNLISGNVGWYSGNLKLGCIGCTDKSYGNNVNGNALYYSGGIEDQIGYGDSVTSNLVYRSRSLCISGTFDRATISDNQCYETNYTNNSVTVGGASQTNGCVVLLNDARIAAPAGNTLSNNKCYTSRNTFTVPAGTTEAGFTGGFLIDTTYSNTQLNGNTTDNTYATVKNFGTNSSIMSALNGVWNFIASIISTGSITSYTSVVAPYLNATSTTATSTFSGNVVASGGINLPFGVLNGQTTGIKTSRYFEFGETSFAALPYLAFNSHMSSSSVAGSFNGFTPSYSGSGASSMVMYADSGSGDLHFVSRSVDGAATEASLGTFGEVFRMKADGSFLAASTTATSTFAGGFAKTGTGTSTFAGGVDLTSGGCFAVGGTCLVSGLNYWTSSGGNIYNNTGTNVGIGDTSPDSKLDVDGNITLKGSAGSNSWTAQRLLFGGDSSGWKMDIGSINNSDVINTPVLTLDDSVRLGIGTTSPFSVLAVAGRSGGTIPLIEISSSTSAFATSSVFRIDKNGLVGIATSTPGSLFSIGGVANFTNASTTFYGSGGINLTSGCFAVGGNCLTQNAGTVTSIATTWPIIGGPITTTGTLSFGGLSTTSSWTAGQLAYVSSSNVVTGVATTTLTASSPLSLSNTVVKVGGSNSVLTLDTTGTWSGNAVTATALAANGANCSSGNAPLGVDASGAVENCFDVWTESENTSAAYAAQATTITIAGTANQITSSAGAQSLAANRTWTLSIPSLFAIGQASTTIFSSYGPAYFGATATSSFSSTGALTLSSPLAIASGGTATTTMYSGGALFYDATLGTVSQPGNGTGLFYDRTNNRVGMGTALPLQRLHLVVSDGGRMRIASDCNCQNAVSGIEFNYANGVANTNIASIDGKLVASNIGTLIFGTGAGSTAPIERARINSTGLGVGTTTLTAPFTLQAASSTVPFNPVFDVWGLMNTIIWLFERIDAWGHLIISGPPPVLSSCGTSPTVTGNDRTGYVTVGSVSATGCVITFAHAYATRPVCHVTNESMSVVNALTYTVTASAITITQTGLTGNIIDYTCQGVQ